MPKGTVKPDVSDVSCHILR